MSLKLLSAVLHPGRRRMEVVVEDSQGVRRHVEYTWESKDGVDVPFDSWWMSVEAEVELQRSIEHDRAVGRELV